MFHCTPDYVLHGVSFANLMLYAAATPTYYTSRDNDWNPALDANTPGNFAADIEEE